MTATRLGAFGFRDAARTEQAVRELSGGLTRSSSLMRQLLPLVLDWLSAGPDPDLGLLGLRRLATGEQRTARLAATFRDSAETARQLCELLGDRAARHRDASKRNPDLVERLDDVARLAHRRPRRAAGRARGKRSVGATTSPTQQQSPPPLAPPATCSA